MFVKSNEAVTQVHYFTAFVPWDQAAAARHNIYIEALKSRGAEIHLGAFRKKWKQCRADCRKRFETYEEKMTDVNLSVQLMLSCVQNRHDVAFVVSGDNDMIPAMEAALQLCPDKKIMILLPPAANSLRMRHWAKGCKVPVLKIKEFHLAASQFPLSFSAGDVFLSKPSLW